MSSITLPSPLYVIADADVCAQARWTLVDFASACLDGGARFLQIRAKHLPGGDFLEATAAIVRRAEAFKALVIVNDRADIARLGQAAGVHVGQEDLSPAQARALVGVDGLVGLSTHTPAQLESALQQNVNYVAVGPVFGTATKGTGYDPIGLEGVRSAAARAAGAPAAMPRRGRANPRRGIIVRTRWGWGPSASAKKLADRGLPLVAIGGITLERAPSVIEAGADSVAVISDLLATGDPASRVRQFLAILDSRFQNDPL